MTEREIGPVHGVAVAAIDGAEQRCLRLVPAGPLLAADRRNGGKDPVVDQDDVLVPRFETKSEPLGGVDPRVVEPARPELHGRELAQTEREDAERDTRSLAAHDAFAVDPRCAQISEIRRRRDGEGGEHRVIEPFDRDLTRSGDPGAGVVAPSAIQWLTLTTRLKP